MTEPSQQPNKAKPSSKKKTAPKATTAKAAVNGHASYGRESAENLAKAQHAVADYVAEQSGIAAKFAKQRFELKTTSPGAAALDAAVDGVERFSEAQKNLVEWAIESRPKAPKASAEKTEPRQFPRVPFRGLLRRGLETMLDAQQELVGLGKAQGYLAVDSLTPLAKGRVTDLPVSFIELTGKAIDNALTAQAHLLDLTVRFSKDANTMLTSGERPVLRKESADAVQRGVDATTSMQKKLLEIAADQTHATVERMAPAREKAVDVKEPRMLEAARDGIDRLTETQLKLLDRSRQWVDKALAN